MSYSFLIWILLKLFYIHNQIFRCQNLRKLIVMTWILCYSKHGQILSSSLSFFIFLMLLFSQTISQIATLSMCRYLTVLIFPIGEQSEQVRFSSRNPSVLRDLYALLRRVRSHSDIFHSHECA